MTEKDILNKCKNVLDVVAQSPALSCVEYYFIAWIKQFINVEPLYAETIVSYAYAEEIIRKNSFENIDMIDRVQNIAEREGIVSHEMVLENDVKLNDDSLHLLKVGSDFFKGKQVPWRYDHYVQVVAMTDRYYYIVNEYPMEIRKISRREQTVLTNEWLIYHFIGASKFKEKPFHMQTKKLLRKMPEVQVFRDALILYRILLRRLKIIMKYDALDFLIKRVDALFFKVALAVRKGNLKNSELSQWREEICQDEKKYISRGVI